MIVEGGRIVMKFLDWNELVKQLQKEAVELLWSFISFISQEQIKDPSKFIYNEDHHADKVPHWSNCKRKLTNDANSKLDIVSMYKLEGESWETRFFYDFG